MFAGRLAGGAGLREVAEAARARAARRRTAPRGRPAARRPGRAASPTATPPATPMLQASAAGVLQRGHCRGGRAALALARRRIIAATSVGRRDLVRRSPIATCELAREAGALSELPLALDHARRRASVRRRARRRAASLVEEAERSTRRPGAISHRMAPSARRPAGPRRRGRGRADRGEHERRRRRGAKGIGVTVTHWANALLCNGLGRSTTR